VFVAFREAAIFPPPPEFGRLRWLSGRCERGFSQVEAG